MKGGEDNGGYSVVVEGGSNEGGDDDADVRDGKRKVGCGDKRTMVVVIMIMVMLMMKVVWILIKATMLLVVTV